MYAAKKNAEGRLLVKEAEAEGERLRNLAMQGVGGGIIVALEAAKNLNLENVTIIPPVFIHPEAQVRSSLIGPHVSLGRDAVIEGSLLKDSIIADGTHITGSTLASSLIGHNVTIEDTSGRVFLGDNSRVVS